MAKKRTHTQHGTLGWSGDDTNVAKFTLVIDYTDIPENTLLSRAAAHDVIAFRRPHKARGRKHVMDNVDGKTFHVNWRDVGKRTMTPDEKRALIARLEAELENETE